jgi:hypothetical protein
MTYLTGDQILPLLAYCRFGGSFVSFHVKKFGPPTVRLGRYDRESLKIDVLQFLRIILSEDGKAYVAWNLPWATSLGISPGQRAACTYAHLSPITQAFSRADLPG